MREGTRAFSTFQVMNSKEHPLSQEYMGTSITIHKIKKMLSQEGKWKESRERKREKVEREMNSQVKKKKNDS